MTNRGNPEMRKRMAAAIRGLNKYTRADGKIPIVVVTNKNTTTQKNKKKMAWPKQPGSSNSDNSTN